MEQMKLDEAMKYLQEYATKNGLNSHTATFGDIKNLYDSNK